MRKKDRPKKAPKPRMRDQREAAEKAARDWEEEPIVITMGERKPYAAKYHHPLILKVGADGGSETEMAVACGLSRSTFRKWQKEHVALGDVVKDALTLAEMYWERRWRDRMDKFGHNANAYKHLMASRFRDTYGERIEVAGDADAPLTVIKRIIVDPKKRGNDAS